VTAESRKVIALKRIVQMVIVLKVTGVLKALASISRSQIIKGRLISHNTASSLHLRMAHRRWVDFVHR
jgi:hypothetical protein